MKKAESFESDTANVADAYRLEDQTGFLLGRAYAKAFRNLSRRLSDLEVTPQQHTAVMKLYEIGEMSQNNLGRLVGMEPATIHGIIKRLVAQGAVELRAAPDDKRKILVTLTPQGRDLAQELAPRSLESTAAMLAPLSAEERATLTALLHRLI